MKSDWLPIEDPIERKLFGFDNFLQTNLLLLLFHKSPECWSWSAKSGMISFGAFFASISIASVIRRCCITEIVARWGSSNSFFSFIMIVAARGFAKSLACCWLSERRFLLSVDQFVKMLLRRARTRALQNRSSDNPRSPSRCTYQPFPQQTAAPERTTPRAV